MDRLGTVTQYLLAIAALIGSVVAIERMVIASVRGGHILSLLLGFKKENRGLIEASLSELNTLAGYGISSAASMPRPH